MKQVTNKLFSIFMSVFFVISCCPAFDSLAYTVNSGGSSWSLDSDGTLTISESGQMFNYEDGHCPAPWKEYYYYDDVEYVPIIKSIVFTGNLTSIGEDAFRYTSISSLVIPDSVTKIGDCAFEFCEDLKSVTIPSSVTTIGVNSFYGCTSLEDVYFNGTYDQFNRIQVYASPVINRNADIKPIWEIFGNAKIHYISPMVITSQPKDYFGSVGDTATFSVTAQGAGIKYQWQEMIAGTWKDSSMPGSRSATLMIPILNSRNGNQYRCVLSNSNEQPVISDIATLYVITPVKITTHPSDYSGVIGTTASFNVVAQGSGLKYQWQTYSNGKWINSSLPGYNTSKLSVPITSSRNGYCFRCEVTDSANNVVKSNSATLKVVSTSLSITSQPKEYSGTLGSTATFKVVVQGTGLKYQWQTYSNGAWKNSSLPGYNTAILSVPVVASRNGYKFRCVVTDSTNKTVASNTVTLTVTTASAVSITTQPKDYTGAVGSTATFKVVAQGTGLKYQWQTYSNGTWKNSSLPGYNTATLSVPVTTARNGYKFRCVVTDSANRNATTNAVTLTVTTASAVSITTPPKDYTGAVGSTATFKVVAQGTGLKYQWQTYINGKWANSALTGAKTSTFSVPVTKSRNGYKFRCVITDSNGKSVTTNAVTLRVS